MLSSSPNASSSKRIFTAEPIRQPVFADSRLTVQGEGGAARDANNNPVAWYDPAEPVSVSFITIGGETELVEGYLPINHAVVLGDSEYRFAITEGPRNFALVTAERCDYP